MLRAVRFAAEGGLRLQGHSHADWHMCVVLDGAFLERTPGGEVECVKGAARLSRPGAEHAIEFDRGGAECLIVEARGPFWNRVLARPLGRGSHRFSRIASEPCGVTPTMAPSPGLAWWIGGLLRAFDDRDDEAPDWVDAARGRIEGDPQVRLSDLARDLGLDREDFALEFRRHVGLRPGEWRTLARLREAVGRLERTDQALAEVALDCGYAHQSHMTNVFRAVAGATPASVRASAGGANLQDGL